jgi:hypothetical protein
MAQFRKIPVVIEAFRWTGDVHQDEDPIGAVEAIKSGAITFTDVGTPEVALHISTLEGTMRADQGDWIIQGIAGEIYPCKPAVFSRTYELVFDQLEAA